MEVGDLTETQRCAERQACLADELGEPTLRWMAAVTEIGYPLAAGHFIHGAIDELGRIDAAQTIQRHVAVVFAEKPPAFQMRVAAAEHEIHHRGQIYTMLGMLNVPTPPIYGMTATDVQRRSRVAPTRR